MNVRIRRYILLVVVIASAAMLLVGCDNPTGSGDDGNSGDTFGAVEAAGIGADRDTTG